MDWFRPCPSHDKHEPRPDWCPLPKGEDAVSVYVEQQCKASDDERQGVRSFSERHQNSALIGFRDGQRRKLINSYPSVYQVGHKAIAGLFNDDVVVQEKIDGSQFSFSVIDGELQARSKGKQLILDAPEPMFKRAVEVIREIEPLLVPGYVYRCEYLEKPKHNTIAYARIPKNHLVLFDVMFGLEAYLAPQLVAGEARALGLEEVPVLFTGRVESQAMFEAMLESESVLGGSKVEGVVVKNYSLFTQEKKMAIGKYVRESFKEEHKQSWKEGKDIVQQIVNHYKTDARWQKAIQHLRDSGELEGSPRDIGKLMLEVPADILKEHEQEIKDRLFEFHWLQIRRALTAGLPEWYKAELMKVAFEEAPNAE